MRPTVNWKLSLWVISLTISSVDSDYLPMGNQTAMANTLLTCDDVWSRPIDSPAQLSTPVAGETTAQSQGINSGTTNEHSVTVIGSETINAAGYASSIEWGNSWSAELSGEILSEEAVPLVSSTTSTTQDTIHGSMSAHFAMSGSSNQAPITATSATQSMVASSNLYSSTDIPINATQGKKGIAFITGALVDALGDKISWAYNWGVDSSGLRSDIEFVPMCHSAPDVTDFVSQINGATHVLSFNEPDIEDQANLDPQTAAVLHKNLFSALKGHVLIGSPAISNGQNITVPQGVFWLDQFFQACGTNCPVDFVAYHWYNNALLDDLESHTDSVVSVANKYGVEKVWLTEFAPGEDLASDALFMEGAVSYLEQNQAVERYAAFMAEGGVLFTDGVLNQVGAAYIS